MDTYHYNNRTLAFVVKDLFFKQLSPSRFYKGRHGVQRVGCSYYNSTFFLESGHACSTKKLKYWIVVMIIYNQIRLESSLFFNFRIPPTYRWSLLRMPKLQKSNFSGANTSIFFYLTFENNYTILVMCTYNSILNSTNMFTQCRKYGNFVKVMFAILISIL